MRGTVNHGDGNITVLGVMAVNEDRKIVFIDSKMMITKLYLKYHHKIFFEFSRITGNNL